MPIHAFLDNSVTGRAADIDHYTQAMWRDTRAIGCAIAYGAREDVPVCRYSHAGIISVKSSFEHQCECGRAGQFYRHKSG